jgi:hypothetical protein
MSPSDRDPIDRDPLTGKLADDPSHPPRLVVFVGLAGDSHTRGHVRLYLDEELRDWFDVAEDDVVYSEKRYVSLGPRTILWVRERTTLHVRRAQPQDIPGEYLRGDVAAETVPQAAAFVALDVSYRIRTPNKIPHDK